jgi:Protein of unknown function (DUF3616)
LKEIRPARNRNRPNQLPRSVVWTAAGIISAMVLILVAFYFLSRSPGKPEVVSLGGLSDGQPRRVGDITAPKPFAGGTFHVSDVGAVAAKHAVLFIDPTKPNYVFWMDLNENGDQVGDIKPLPLGVTVHNPRGITQLGLRYLIVGDLAAPSPTDGSELVSFTMNAETQSIASVQSLTGLRRFLLENVPELKSSAAKTGDEGGLVVEALALSLDPQSPKIFLGCRRPLINGKALVISLRLNNPAAPFAVENLELAQPNTYQLSLAGQGIRGFRYDSHLKSYLIISEASGEKQNDGFTLWEWNGESNADPQKLIPLDGAMLPGGLTRVKIAEREYLFIAGEGSTYAKVEYAKE